MARQAREQVEAQKLLLYKDFWKAKRNIKRVKHKANCPIRDKNRRLADILESIRSLSMEHNQATALRGAAGIKLDQPTTNMEDARPLHVANKWVSSASSQGSQHVSTSAWQLPVKRPLESAPSI